MGCGGACTRSQDRGCLGKGVDKAAKQGPVELGSQTQGPQTQGPNKKGSAPGRRAPNPRLRSAARPGAPRPFRRNLPATAAAGS